MKDKPSLLSFFIFPLPPYIIVPLPLPSYIFVPPPSPLNPPPLPPPSPSGRASITGDSRSENADVQRITRVHTHPKWDYTNVKPLAEAGRCSSFRLRLPPPSSLLSPSTLRSSSPFPFRPSSSSPSPLRPFSSQTHISLGGASSFAL